jgi:hypothetical protein
MSRVKADPADETTEHYRQLIRRNHDFCRTLSAALKSGTETAAGMTATVRTTVKAKRHLSLNSDRTQVTA